MTKLTKLEVGNPPSRGQQLHLHLHLPPRNGQDRDRPLSDPPRIGLTARCRQQGGLEEWPNTAGTAPTNSLAPHDQRPNSDQKHGQCQTDFINRSPPPHLQPLGRRVWPCFAHRHWSSTHHRHHRPAAVRGGPSAPPEPNARVGRVPTALPATPPERTFSLFILAPFCADGLCHAAQCAPGSRRWAENSQEWDSSLSQAPRSWAITSGRKTLDNIRPTSKYSRRSAETRPPWPLYQTAAAIPDLRENILTPSPTTHLYRGEQETSSHHLTVVVVLGIL